MRGNSQGTGFFISPDTIVTNRHVIHGEEGTVYIASKFVGVTPARVLAESGTGDFDDFALLRVAPQANVVPFTLTSNTAQLQPVVASGFPGLHQATNPAFERMREGDRSALEDVTPTDTRGEINATQRQNASMTLIIHSAVISPGNSGGPLLDFCGRVAGVNTFVRVDERMPVSAFYALSSTGLQKFLASTGLATQVDESACAATVAAPPVPQPAAPPPGEQQGAARARDARTPSTSGKR